MATITQTAERFADQHHRPLTTATLVVLFWLTAAGTVAAVHKATEPLSPTSGAFASVAALLVTAWAYSRFVAKEAGITHALGVGIAWLVLSVATEMALTGRAGHGSFPLLGSPGQPLLRNVLLFVWVFAPVLFARRKVIS